MSGHRGDASIVTWLQSPFALALLCALGVLPLVFTSMPPLMDLGGHLGRYAIQVDAGASATLRQWYSYHWSLIPNLGVDLLMQGLAPRLGLEPALKLIVLLIPPLQMAGWLLLARAAHGHVPPTTLFALPLAYGFPFQYGFLNFALCAALATCCLALWVTLANRRTGLGLRWALFVPLACVLWVTHLAGYAVFCVLAAADEAWRLKPKDWASLDTPAFCRAALRSMLLLSCLLAPWLLKLLFPNAAPGHSVGPAYLYEHHTVKIKLFYLIMPLRDRWVIWDILSALVLLAVISWGWSSPRFSRHGGLVLGAACLTVLFVFLPGELAGGTYVDMRLLPAMLGTALIATSPRAIAGGRFALQLAIAGLVFAGARLAGDTVSMILFDRQFTQDLTELDSIPRDSQLASLTVKACHTTYATWSTERRAHLAGYAIARRHDFSNEQWMIPGQQLLQIHNPAAGAFVSDPSEMTTAQACEEKPGVMEVAAGIPMATRYLWLLEAGPHRDFPGWHAIRSTPDSAMYIRD